MRDTMSFAYDAAPAISVGRRDQQEDTVAADFADGAGLGFVVLADGMGGHSAGDVASKIVVTEIFSELKMLANDPANLERNIGPIMRRAVVEANHCVGQVAQQRAGMAGMGSTLVAPIVFGNRLYWISVGDSPLYLFRGSRLFRLNEEHSLAAQLAKKVARGEIDAADAATHPDRQCLTSVLIGTDIPEVDCRETPVTLRDNDILIAASDGLQFISERQMAHVIYENRHLPSAEITAKLLQSISDLDDPDQDNVSLCVLKILDRSTATAPLPHTTDHATRDTGRHIRRQSR